MIRSSSSSGKSRSFIATLNVPYCDHGMDVMTRPVYLRTHRCGRGIRMATHPMTARAHGRRHPMAKQYSLAHLTVLGCAPPEMTYIAARAGYDFVSIRCIYMGLPGEPNYELAKNPEMLRQTQRALKATGVRLHDIELARIKDEVDPKSYLPALEVAAELGARAVLSSIWTPEREYAIEKFGELCDLARQFNLTVDLEPVPIAGVRTTAEAVDVLRAVGRPN